MVLITVFSENAKTRLDPQSILKLTNLTTEIVSWQATSDESEVNFGDVPFGHYDVAVSAIGDLSGP